MTEPSERDQLLEEERRQRRREEDRQRERAEQEQAEHTHAPNEIYSHACIACRREWARPEEAHLDGCRCPECDPDFNDPRNREDDDRSEP